MENTPFGRYRLIELLGRGGMGEVWRAHDTVTDRVVAIKVLPAHFSEDEDFQRRFRREAHAAARLDTPHVVPIHDYGEIAGRLFVSMRLIKGRDLDTVLAEGPLDPARAVRIIDQVAKALHAAHKVGLLHRDIKPSNILLDDDDFAYLIDFGIARAADETRLTKSGNTIGTFAYIAPERLDPRTEEDARADIYSLACVLYEALTGQPPFAGTTTAHLMFAHVNTPPPRPSTTQPNVPPQVDEVIATGMAKDPDQRYATTIELADAAHHALTTEPTAVPSNASQAAPASTVADDEVSAQTAPALVGQEPAVSTLAATQEQGPSGAAPVESGGAADRPSPPTPQLWWSRQRRPGLIAAIVVILAAGAGITGYLLRQPSTTSTTTAPTTTTRTIAPPVAEAALEGLLLSPDQINTAMGATGMTVTGSSAEMGSDSARVADKACVYVESGSDSFVYAGSGRTAFREQWLSDHPPAGTFSHYVNPAVVLFPYAHDAGAFFTASVQSWSACSNRQYTVTQAGFIDQTWTVGQVTNTNGTLSISTTDLDSRPKGWTCQRALTVANNVVIDVTACSGNPADSAVNIAHQIAAKVPTT
jgi:serine/threonine kinase PknH